jgi:hypothetical protein
MKPRTTIANPKGQSRRQRQIGFAAPRADARISVQHGAVQVFDEDNSVGLAPALVLRQTPSAHDQVNFLPQNASPAVGFRLGALKRVDNGLLVVGDEGDQARRRLTAESTPIRLTARRALRRLRAAPEKNTEARASIAIKKARAASRPRALTGEERISSKSLRARDGHRFESPQLHHSLRRIGSYFK